MVYGKYIPPWFCSLNHKILSHMIMCSKNTIPLKYETQRILTHGEKLCGRQLYYVSNRNGAIAKWAEFWLPKLTMVHHVKKNYYEITNLTLILFCFVVNCYYVAFARYVRPLRVGNVRAPSRRACGVVSFVAGPWQWQPHRMPHKTLPAVYINGCRQFSHLSAWIIHNADLVLTGCRVESARVNVIVQRLTYPLRRQSCDNVTEIKSSTVVIIFLLTI